MKKKIFLFDIDGVLIQNGKFVPDIAHYLSMLINSEKSVKLVTNCSLHKIHNFSEKLLVNSYISIVDPIDVLLYMGTHNKDFFTQSFAIIGTKEIIYRVQNIGIKIRDITSEEKIDNILVFEKIHYDQDVITKAARMVINGSKLFHSGIERTTSSGGEIYPGVGAIISQIRYMTRKRFINLGKPSKFIIDIALEGNVDKNEVLFIGDNYETDIVGANNAGIDSILLSPDKLQIKKKKKLKGVIVCKDLADFFKFYYPKFN